MINLLYAFFLLLSPEPATVSLKVEITNLKSGKGKLWVAMYRPQDKFGAEKPEIFKIVKVEQKVNQIAEFDLQPGKYALAVYHDLNDNSVLDKNFIGIPKEPYGFSNDFRPKFSAPVFKDCAFDLPESGRKIFVKLTN